jgi:hypothetical protein
MISPTQAWKVCRYMGARWVAYRLKYEVQKRSGHLARKAPTAHWRDIPLQIENEQALGFIPRSTATWRERLQAFDSETLNVTRQADDILAGRFTLFGHLQADLGFPPDWNKNILTDQQVSAQAHWSRIGDFSSGDIKAVWENSRFPWAFSLGRAYARTANDDYAEGFWRLFDDWINTNQPNRGPQWKCGQEASFRLFAAAWARRVFSDSPATTIERVKVWRRFVYATGRRIAANLEYALSQSNNHGISECVALLTVSRLLPQAPEAAEWRIRASQSLISQVDALVYPDGAFSQHSTVYHRVLLHDLAWVLALESENGATVDAVIVSGCRRAWQYLSELTDATSGHAPLSGASDGSNVLPLSNSAYDDFRPAIQLASVLTDGVAALSPGLWDESVFWLTNGREFKSAPIANGLKPLWSAPHGGWTIVRTPLTRIAFHTRTGYQHRPSHADLLHVDVWWRDQLLTRDPGSFSYNTNRPQSSFVSTVVHNTVEVNGTSQMEKATRFLLLPWPSGQAQHNKKTLTVKASHDAYERLGVIHSRTVQPAGAEGWVVTDEVTSQEKRRPVSCQLHWLFGDGPHTFDSERQRLTLHLPHGDYSIEWHVDAESSATLVRAHESSDRGWWSPHYLELQPALSLAIRAVGAAGNINMRTVFGPLVVSAN